MMYLWCREKLNTNFQDLLLSGLINGTKDSEGNVFMGGKPVCDDSWDLNDAKVACHQFGFRNVVRATQSKDTKF